MVSVGLLFAFFYIVVVSWSVWYLIASVGLRLEWAHCGHDYNTDDCYEISDLGNATSTAANASNSSSVEEYWERYVQGSQDKDWYHFVSAMSNLPSRPLLKNIIVFRATLESNPSAPCSSPGAWCASAY